MDFVLKKGSERICIHPSYEEQIKKHLIREMYKYWKKKKWNIEDIIEVIFHFEIDNFFNKNNKYSWAACYIEVRWYWDGRDDFTTAGGSGILCMDETTRQSIVLDPEEDITNSNIKFYFWDLKLTPPPYELFEEEIKTKSKKKISRKFKYEIDGSDYPDVIFNITFSHSVDEKVLKSINDTFNGFMKKLLDVCDDPDDAEAQILHYVGVAQMEGESNTASIHVDFGDCEPEMIDSLLDEIAISLKKVTYVFVE